MGILECWVGRHHYIYIMWVAYMPTYRYPQDTVPKSTFNAKYKTNHTFPPMGTFSFLGRRISSLSTGISFFCHYTFSYPQGVYISTKTSGRLNRSVIVCVCHRWDLAVRLILPESANWHHADCCDAYGADHQSGCNRIGPSPNAAKCNFLGNVRQHTL